MIVIVLCFVTLVLGIIASCQEIQRLQREIERLEQAELKETR